MPETERYQHFPLRPCEKSSGGVKKPTMTRYVRPERMAWRMMLGSCRALVLHNGISSRVKHQNSYGIRNRPRSTGRHVEGIDMMARARQVLRDSCLQCSLPVSYPDCSYLSVLDLSIPFRQLSPHWVETVTTQTNSRCSPITAFGIEPLETRNFALH